MSEPKTLLVTGGAGFIGSCFVGQCVARGQKVIVLDKLTYAGHRENLDWISGMGSWELVQGDIGDGALVSGLLQKYEPHAIVHFAAESHVDNSIASPAEFIHTNINGTYTMLEAARQYWSTLDEAAKQAFRFVHVSTDEVYGSLGAEGKFSESTPIQPNSPYSASKAAGDLLARAWFHTYGLPTITTNCSNNYGPRQHPEKLIPLMVTNALSGKALPVYGKGNNVRDWIHVEDHCAGVYLALVRGRVGETYCFGGNAEKQNLDVVHTICDVLQQIEPKSSGSYRDQIQFVTDRAGHDFRYAIDDSKAQRLLGFKRQHSFQSGLKATVEWYVNNHAWCDAIKQKKAA